MKYCVDCQFIRGTGAPSHPRCDRFAEERNEENPVHGKIVWWDRPFCEHARAPTGKCGPDATGWVKRELPPKMLAQRDDSLFARVFGPWHSF